MIYICEIFRKYLKDKVYSTYEEFEQDLNLFVDKYIVENNINEVEILHFQLVKDDFLKNHIYINKHV